jgi:hypothetical protein
MLTTILGLVLLFACSKHEAGHGPEPAASQPAAGVQTVEIACAGCVFQMEGAKGCQPAIKLAGQTLKVTGVAFDAHASGLCDGTKKAEVSGKVVDGTYVATSLKVLP